MEIVKLNCPHCKQKLISRTSLWRCTLDSPLRACPHCNGMYLMPRTFEWSYLGLLGKLFYCFIDNVRGIFILVVFNYLYLFNLFPKQISLWVIAYIAVSLFLLIIFDRKKIKASYLRTKNNPEYIQNLSNLGYMDFDYILFSYGGDLFSSQTST